jgi:hypothetical protein
MQKLTKYEIAGEYDTSKVNNQITKELNDSEGNEISNVELKRIMIRRLMRRKDLYKHFNEFFFGSFWV